MIEEIKDIKDIENYEGLYAITKDGKVWSYKRKKFLKPSNNGSGGYYYVNLWKNGKGRNFRIHRLVAETYIPNPNNLPEVNHKDEDKSNNCVDNLEWISKIDNINYGTRTERAAKKTSIPVYCVELDRVFDGAAQASRELGFDRGSITKCCRDRLKTAGGYHWRYAETSVEEV